MILVEARIDKRQRTLHFNYRYFETDAPKVLFQWGAGTMSCDASSPSVDDLADQIVDVLDYFGLGEVMCMGVTAGAYILTLFAMKYKQRVLGLILVSPLCRPPSWTEWLYNKVMSNLLYLYGMCAVVKEMLVKRYFGKVVIVQRNQFSWTMETKALNNNSGRTEDTASTHSVGDQYIGSDTFTRESHCNYVKCMVCKLK